MAARDHSESQPVRESGDKMKRRLGKVGRWVRFLLLVALVGFICLNALAYFHAKNMLRYDDGGTKTEAVEELSVADKLLVVVRGVKLPRPVAQQTPGDYALPYRSHQFVGNR